MAGYDGATLTSDIGLALPLRVANDFTYIGADAFVLKGLAEVERHHFVDARPSPRRLVVVQFERYLPGVGGSYRYTLDDPVTLGGEVYGRMSNILTVAQEIAEEPGAEMEHTAAFLAARGIALGREHAVARYARIVGDDRRAEILLFYHEVGGSTDGIHARAERVFEPMPAPQR